MNIAIDVLAILGPDSKNRGIGNYCTSQLKKLFEIDKENRYFLLNFYEDTSLLDMLNYSENVSEHYFFLGRNGFMGKEDKFSGLFGDLIKKFISLNKIDVFYFTSLFDHHISYDIKWFDDVKTAATLYDIIPFIFKERYLADKVTYNYYMGHIEKLKKIDKLLAISQSAKDDVVNYLKIDKEKVDVIYAGTDDCYREIDISLKEEKEIRELYGIKNKYIMCTGGDDDRKNIAGLIKAFSRMPRKLIDEYQLVIACKLSKQSEERYYGIATNHKVRENVILTNFVPLDHLIKLYNLAHIVAFPSQYEGFGLPVVEAMACGTPVLTSNNSSLGEIAEGAAVLVDPFNVTDITRGLIEILQNTDLNLLKQRGTERVKQFNWDMVSQRTLHAIKSMNKNNSIMLMLEEKQRKKIAFFTPLPPLKSGISDYSVDILNELSEYFIIDVYIDDNYKHSCTLSDGIAVYEHSYFNSKKHEYYDTIYQMGNSDFHTYMINYIKTNPGTLVLHDYNLHGLVYHLSAKNKLGMDKYKYFLYEDYLSDVINSYVDDLAKGTIHPKIYDLPCNGFITNYANKIIVHSDYSKKLLLEKNIQRNVKKIFHYAHIGEPPDRKAIREKLRINHNALVLAAFGHIHETKRIMPLVKAFKKLSEKFDHVVLFLVGKPSEHTAIKDELENYVSSFNLDKKIIVTGYTDLEVFEEYIEVTDVCINLRYPYNGETSGSLMRMLSKGKCSIVSNIGSFSEIPDDCCLKLKSAQDMSETEEVNMIYSTLESVVRNPHLINKVGEKAGEFALVNLDIKKIVKQYADYINERTHCSIDENLLVEIMNTISEYDMDYVELHSLTETLAYTKI